MFKHLVYVAGKPVTPPSSALKRVRRQRRERDDTRGALESGKEVRQSSIWRQFCSDRNCLLSLETVVPEAKTILFKENSFSPLLPYHLVTPLSKE